MGKLRRLLLVAILVPLVCAVLLPFVTAGACSTNSSHRYAPAAAAEAYTVTNSAQSFSFQKYWVHTVREEKTLEENLQGTYQAPDRTRLRLTSWQPELEPRTSEAVMVGDRMYVKAEGYDIPGLPEWDATRFMPGEFLLGDSEWAEPHRSLLRVNCLTDVEMLEDEDVQGMPCHHYRGKLNTDKYVASLDWTVPYYKDPDRFDQEIGDIERADVKVEFWTDQEDGLIRRIVEDWDLHPERSGYVTDYIVTEFQDYNSRIEVVSPVPNPIPIPDIAATAEQWGVTVTLVPHVTALSYLHGELSEILGWRIYLDSGPYQHVVVRHGLAFDLGDGEAVFDGDFGACFGCGPGAYSEGGSLVPHLEQDGLHEGQRIRAFAVIVTPEGILRSPCIAFTLVEKVDWEWRYADFELEPSTDITLPTWLQK